MVMEIVLCIIIENKLLMMMTLGKSKPVHKGAKNKEQRT